MYRLVYHKQALKVLLKMPREIAQRIQRELKRVALDPRAYGGDWKPLLGSPFWRLRVGSWRAVCELRNYELIIYVLKVGSRGDVYK